MRAIREQFSNISFHAWILAASTLVSSIGNSFLRFVGIYLTSKLNYDLEITGIMLFVYGAFYFVGGIVFPIFDRYINYRKLLIISMSGTIIGLLIFYFSPHYYIAITASAVIGSFSGGIRPLSNMLVAATVNKQGRMQATALLTVSRNVGMALCGVIAGALATIDLSWIFLLDAIMTVIAMALILLIPVATSAEAKSIQIADIQRNAKLELSYIIFLLWLFFINLVYFQYAAYQPVFLSSVVNLTPIEIGIMTAISSVLIIIFQFPITAYARNFRLNFTLACGALLLCLGYAFLYFATSFELAIISNVAVAFGIMILSPAALEVAFRYSEGKSKGRYFASHQAVYSSAMALASPVGFGIVAMFGSNTIWIICGCLGVLGASIVMLLPLPAANADT